MEPLTLPNVIGRLVENYVRTAIEGNRDCRLLIPGLTPALSEQLHDYLHEHLPRLVNSYLVIGESEVPNEEKGKIKAIGLTSKRIGSFVAITSPGQLVHIQDSIRGSGGTIRSMAFSEEWPWIDDVGSESFRFDGPVLNELVKGWTSKDTERIWLREFTVKGLLEYSRSSSRRGRLLLEDIIGKFSPDLYPEIPDIREKMLFHAGLPCPGGHIPAVKEVIQKSYKLCKEIVDIYQKDENIREQARENVEERFAGQERDNLKKSIDYFFDKMGNSETLDLGILAFHGCWDSPRCWRLLDAETLGKLFKVKPEETTIKYTLHCARGFISKDGKKLATFHGEQVGLTVAYSNLPEDFLTRGKWTIQVFHRQSPIVEPVEITNPRGNGEVLITLDTSVIGNYSRIIPLRIAVALDGFVQVEERLHLHLCGPNRPAFIVVERGFDIVDLVPTSEDDIPEKKIMVDEPVTVYLFESVNNPPVLQNELGKTINLIPQEGRGIWKPAEMVNVSDKPTGQVTWTFQVGDDRAVICFEAEDVEKGEFTLEDELRVLLSDPKIPEKRIENLFHIFTKRESDPYPRLGGLDDAARRRLFLSKVITDDPRGFRPVLTNLLDSDYDASASIGDFIISVGKVENEDFKRVNFPQPALNLLQEYNDARKAILNEVFSYNPRQDMVSDHPVYSSHPIFVNECSNGMEKLAWTYLDAYAHILDYISSQRESLDWHQLFVLVYLDCIVDWSNTRDKYTFFLLGPWHPLVIAKRFMVQSALFERGYQLLIEGRNEAKDLRHLAALLSRVQGFKWVIALSTRDTKIEPAFVSTTNDPGWHVAFKAGTAILSRQDQSLSLSEISRRLWKNLGLSTEAGVGGNQDLPVMALSNYMNSFPSRRSIGVRICHGYDGNEVIKKIDAFLHNEENPSESGLELPGGVRVYLQDALVGDADARWTNPPFFIYSFKNDEDCLSRNHPDIFMSQSTSDVTYREGDRYYELPRGVERQAVFFKPLNYLAMGPSSVPDSVTYEFDKAHEPGEDIGSKFIATLGRVSNFVRYPKEKISSIELPDHLNAPWLVIPGHALDPAVLVNYVCNCSMKAPNERALWDYKVNIGGQNSSYYILSTIPRGFQVAVNGFFGREDIAGQFISELGRIGIAIGGEALKSGRRALGIIGLVGAVRLLYWVTKTSLPMPQGKRSVGFLIPVDSFESFFGKTGSGEKKRSDLLVVNIQLPRSANEKMRISACGVEAKFVSSTNSQERATHALEQAKATTKDFKKLATSSLGKGAIPERLALLEIIWFGLRISSQSVQSDNESWLQLENCIYQSILHQNYEYSAPSHEAILVSTEAGLHGPAECDILPSGLWIRLTKTHWPGIVNESQFKSILEHLSRLFYPTPLETTQQTTLIGTTSPITSTGETVDVHSPHPKPQPINPFGTAQQGQNAAMQGSTDSQYPRNLQKIFIGVDESRVAKYFDPKSPVDPLDNMNMMVTGSSGTGKTQFLKYLICKFREQDQNVLVLDFKNDFANDEKFCNRARLERIFVNFDGLPYNPLIPFPVRHPVKGEQMFQPRQHIAGVASVLRRTYHLGDQQEAALKNAIISAFTATGIPTTDTLPFVDNNQFPDFSVVGNILEHDNRNAHNRLEPLFSLGLFKPDYRAISFHELTERSMVIDLSMIPSDNIKNALAQLVVMSAHAYFNSIPHTGAIRQLFVIDEAFRILDYEYMAEFVLQCRAYGVGMILSSQYPSQFPMDISSSLATKVLHGNGGDSNRIREIVQLIHCEGREADIASLERFQAFLDNRHYRKTLLRTMNYPLYLVWEKLQKTNETTREELSLVEGLNTSMLPIGNLVEQLKRMGLADERDGKVFIIHQTD